MRFVSYDNPVQMATATTLIMALAAAGIIDKKYVFESNALYAAKYVILNTTYCIKVNYAVTGSFATEPSGMYVLLLNGALDYLDNGGGCCNGNFGCR